MPPSARAGLDPDPAPRVLVIGPQLAMLRACEEALGRSALVRTCLGARAGGRAVMTWDPSVIVLDHDPPGLDAVELLRSWQAGSRFVPEVVLYSRASREGLELLARRHAGVHVVPAPAAAGVLVSAVLRAHRASITRREASKSHVSGSRRRPRESP